MTPALAAPKAQAQVQTSSKVEGQASSKVEGILSKLTLEQRIDQMIMSYPPLSKTDKVTVGSVIFLGNLLKDPDDVKARVANLQSRSPIPLFVAADVEGGHLNKFKQVDGMQDVPSNLELAKAGVDATRSWGRKVGTAMTSLGLNMALAPVLDTAAEGLMFESERTFGGDLEQVGELGQAWSQGLTEAGVVAVGKHWPGYGELAENTDHSFVVTQRSEAQVLQQTQPFVKVGDGMVGVMLANVGYSSYGSTPAILSKELVDLAHRQGWLTITDDLAIEMLAQATGGDQAEVVRRAFLAGNDILLTTAPVDWDKALDYRGVMLDLALRDPALKDRVDESVRRILTAKERMGLLGRLVERHGKVSDHRDLAGSAVSVQAKRRIESGQS